MQSFYETGFHYYGVEKRHFSNRLMSHNLLRKLYQAGRIDVDEVAPLALTSLKQPLLIMFYAIFIAVFVAIGEVVKAWMDI